MKNKWFVFILLAVVACCITGCKTGMLRKAEEVHRLTPEEFPILPWSEPWRHWGPPNNLKTLTDIADCGFNLAGFVAPEELDTAKAAGLKAIVFEKARDTGIHVVNNMSDLTMPEVRQRVTAVVDQVSKNEALFAYYLRDEPGADLYPALGKFVDALRKIDPDHPAYINLFPNYASAEQMDVPTYQQYVDSFIATVRPAFISYDHYAMASDDTVANCYWTNIETIRTAARKNNIPFWNIACATKCPIWAAPSPATLRFQLYTTLAYGAKGISWYMYFNWPKGLSNDFTLAPIDINGNKTQTWYMLRDVNMQLHRVGRIYMTLNNINVFHYPTVPDGCVGIETSRFVQSLSGGEFCVGEFKDASGVPYIMLVNKSLTDAVNFDMTLKKSGRVSRVNSNTGKLEPLKSKQKHLDPGEGMLLRLPN